MEQTLRNFDAFRSLQAVEPRLLAVSGVKNSGKTMLIERLLPLLEDEGLRVAVIKHDGHGFTPDMPGTDSFRFWHAGACGTAVFDGEKFSLTRRGGATEQELASFFPNADLILLEGFKNSFYPKLEIIRSCVSASSAVRHPETCIALVSDLPLRAGKTPVFHPNAVRKLSAFLLKYLYGLGRDDSSGESE